MAEDNPKIQIKTLKKPINNSREAYLAENEKNILGTRGFKFALGKYTYYMNNSINYIQWPIHKFVYYFYCSNSRNAQSIIEELKN